MVPTVVSNRPRGNPGGVVCVCGGSGKTPKVAAEYHRGYSMSRFVPSSFVTSAQRSTNTTNQTPCIAAATVFKDHSEHVFPVHPPLGDVDVVVRKLVAAPDDACAAVTTPSLNVTTREEDSTSAERVMSKATGG